jgi:hypothetical protein
MKQRIKVGDVYLELSEKTSATIKPNPEPQTLKAERPEISELAEQPQYIYRPNDPFFSEIDSAHAIASINTSHKPWVKRTWFILFVIGPLVIAQFFALAHSLRHDISESWQIFLLANGIIMPIWFLYYGIWRRKMRKPTAEGVDTCTQTVRK